MRYCPKVRPGLNGPKPTAHEYLSFSCLLIPKNEDANDWFGRAEHVDPQQTAGEIGGAAIYTSEWYWKL